MTSIDNVFKDTAQEGQDLVLGLGSSGYSCVQFLMRQGRDVRVADSRMQPPFANQLRDCFPNIEVDFGGFEHKLLDQVGRLVVSPGIPSHEPIVQQALKANIPVISDVELFAQVVPAPVIAITGSNGKSTVTTWIAHVLEQAGYQCATGGNLGVPALELLDQEIPDFYILELSSFQLERTHSLYLKTAVILNLGTDHIDHHGSIESYHEAKWRITNHCEHAVIFAGLEQDENFSLVDSKAKVTRYGGGGAFHLLLSKEQINDDPNNWLCRNAEKLLPTSVLKVVGYHNHLNALAVMAVAETCGLEWVEIVEGLTSFNGLDHRMQWIGESYGVTWINDSKATNVDATIAALDSISGPIILIAGGMSKDADFAPLAATCADPKNKIRYVILIGIDAQKIERALGTEVNISHAEDMAIAVSDAAKYATTGDTVLLSPACASFDMFDGYEHRGAEFERAWRLIT